MDNKVKFPEFAGGASSGPSRESLFDSLRLNASVKINFTCTNREIIPFSGTIVKCEKEHPLYRSENHLWIIKFLFDKEDSEKYNSGKPMFWEGKYSTQSREGDIWGSLPKCLIRG